MMQVMAFDAGRRGRLIREQDLTEYSRKLALAVTEAMHYFIGHDDASPRDANRYLAVTAAHITHMLRDGREDAELGYTNIPSEYLQARGISPQDSASPAYREWVCGRVQLARMYFRAGRDHLRRVRNLRCRLAGFAYVARFEWMLQVIERDRFCLRKAYPQRKSLSASLWMLGCALSALTASQPNRPGARRLAVQPVRIEPR
jgi:phytoene/squalene synthetase